MASRNYVDRETYSPKEKSNFWTSFARDYRRKKSLQRKVPLTSLPKLKEDLQKAFKTSKYEQ